MAQTRSVGAGRGGGGGGGLEEEGEEEEEEPWAKKRVLPLRDRPGRTRAPSRETFAGFSAAAAAAADRRSAQDSGVVATICCGKKGWLGVWGEKDEKVLVRGALMLLIVVDGFFRFSSVSLFSHHQWRLQASSRCCRRGACLRGPLFVILKRKEENGRKRGRERRDAFVSRSEIARFASRSTWPSETTMGNS